MCQMCLWFSIEWTRAKCMQCVCVYKYIIFCVEHTFYLLSVFPPRMTRKYVCICFSFPKIDLQIANKIIRNILLKIVQFCRPASLDDQVVVLCSFFCLPVLFILWWIECFSFLNERTWNVCFWCVAFDCFYWHLQMKINWKKCILQCRHISIYRILSNKKNEIMKQIKITTKINNYIQVYYY